MLKAAFQAEEGHDSPSRARMRRNLIMEDLMMKRRVAKTAFVLGLVGLLLLPALVYTQVTGRVLNPRSRQTYTSLSAAVAAAAANDTLLVSGTLSGANAILDSSVDTPPAGLKILAGRGLRGTLQISSADCAGTTNGAILDVSARAGALTIVGLKLVVPNGCIGVFSAGGGNPLTVRNLLIQRATTTANIQGIVLGNESGGPFLIEGNTIPSVGSTAPFSVGILVDGDGATAIDATVRRNRVGSAGAPTRQGIVITEAPTNSSVLVERNIVDGGNNVNSLLGIGVGASDTVTVQRNTVRNFVGAAAPDAIGIGIGESTNVQILRNAITNNDVGVAVCDGAACGGIDNAETADTVVINFNNITSTVANATGLLFVPDPAATAPLDATQNWWGAADGPRDINGDADACPEASGATCATPQPGAPDGTGLPVDAGAGGGTPECGTNPGEVTTCPFRTSPVSPAGA